MEKIRFKKEDDWDMNRLEQEIKMAAHQIKRFWWKVYPLWVYMELVCILYEISNKVMKN